MDPADPHLGGWTEAGLPWVVVGAVALALAALTRAAQSAREATTALTGAPVSDAAEERWLALGPLWWLAVGVASGAALAWARPAHWNGVVAAVAAAWLAIALGADALPRRVGRRFPNVFSGRLVAALAAIARPLWPLVRPQAEHHATADVEPAVADEALLLAKLLEASEGDGESGDSPLVPEVLPLLRRVLQLRETPVQELMEPRSGLAWVGPGVVLRRAAEIMVAEDTNRLLVGRGALDRVAGILHLKDVFVGLHKWEGGEPPVVEEVMRPATEVRPDQTLSALIAAWHAGGGSASVVRAPDGAVLGLIRLPRISRWLLAEVTDDTGDLEARA